MGSDDELTIAIQRFDLKTFCVHNGGEKEGRDEFLLPCPRCRKQKLSVNWQQRRWRCFSCEQYRHRPDGTKEVITGAGGLFTLIEWLSGMGRTEVARWIIAHARPPVDDGTLPEPFVTASAPVAKRPTGLPDKCLAIRDELPYMVRRRITVADATQWGLGYVPEGSGWLANRIVFPVWERGQCLYWQARACWDEREHVQRWPGDKYRKSLNPPGERDGIFYLGSSDVLLNLEQAATHPRVAICEGPTSAIRVGPSAVATFGKNLSQQQMTRLLQAGVRAVDFMWDGPTPGRAPDFTRPENCRCHGNPGCAWQHAIAAAAQLAPFIDVRVVFFAQGDPGDYSREDLARARQSAVPVGQLDMGRL